MNFKILDAIKDEFKERFYWPIREVKNRVFCGLKNLKNWFGVIWSDREWDWFYLLKIMEKKLFHMEKFYDDPKNCIGVNHKRVSKDIKMCRILVSRIMNKDYFNNSSFGFHSNHTVKDLCEHEGYMMNQDLEYLFHIMRRKLFTWWD
jgi:hypothetical protein